MFSVLQQKNTSGESANGLTGKNIRNRVKRQGKYSAFDVALGIFLFVIAAIMILPFYNAVLVSITPYKDYVENPFYLIPTSLDFSAYKILAQNPLIYTGTLISIFNSVVGTLLSVSITIMAAYALSQKTLPGRKVLLTLILFTMYFNGGLVPSYITIRSLGFRNSILSMIVPNVLNTFYMILMKNYLLTIPKAMKESAQLDGANAFTILFRIIIPVSAPIIATISLFYAVDRWNDWWMAMLYVDKSSLWPLPYILRKVAIEATLDLGSLSANEARNQYKDILPMTIQMATVLLTMVPILIVYPFLQKYFSKGIMLGSIKE